MRQIFSSLALTIAFLPYRVLAQAGLDKSLEDIESARGKANIKNFSSIETLFVEILKFLFGFLAIIAVIILVYSGFKYLTSLGDEKKTEEAKHMILYAIIGLIIIGGAAIIANTVITLIKTP